MSNEKTTYSKPPRKDVFFLNVSELNTMPDFNIRQDYGDLNSLAKSIESNGVRVPLRGHKKGEYYIITDGHRRFEAAKILLKKGIEIRLPFINEGRECSDEQRVIDMLICNDGKRLNPVEESEAIKRLANFGYSDSEISEKTGFSKIYIYNLKTLQSAPKKLKDMIINNLVSATLAMKVLREEKDFNKAVETIEGAIISNSSKEGSKKITEKDLRKQNGSNNSYSALKKAFKKGIKKHLVVRQDKVDLYNFIENLNNGAYTTENLLSELFEPVPEKVKRTRKKKQLEMFDAE